MSRESIKFIAADMDGTLLNENSELDNRFFPLFEELDKRGIWFAAASGRQYYSLLDTFAPIKDRMLFIAENGTLVMHKGKELYSNPIAPAAVQRIITEARKIPGAHLVLCGKRSAYIETSDARALQEVNKYYHRCQRVADVLSIDDEFIKVAICHFDGTEEHVYPVMNAAFGMEQQVVISGQIWLDIMNAKASKGAAIQQLQQTLGFTYEQTMSFGDYLNDVEMLEVSYYSYAMENAHDKLKAFARFRAPSNRDAGVLTVINRYLQGQGDLLSV